MEFTGQDIDWATALELLRKPLLVLQRLSKQVRSIRQSHIPRNQTARHRTPACNRGMNIGGTDGCRLQVVHSRKLGSPPECSREYTFAQCPPENIQTEHRRSLTLDSLETTSVRFKVSDLRKGVWRPYWNGPSPFGQPTTDSSPKHDLQHRPAFPASSASSDEPRQKE